MKTTLRYIGCQIGFIFIAKYVADLKELVITPLNPPLFQSYSIGFTGTKVIDVNHAI